MATPSSPHPTAQAQPPPAFLQIPSAHSKLSSQTSSPKHQPGWSQEVEVDRMQRACARAEAGTGGEHQ